MTNFHLPLSAEDVDDLLTVPEAAALMGCSTESLNARVATFRVPALWGYPMDSDAPVAHLSIRTARILMLMAGDAGAESALQARQLLTAYLESARRMSVERDAKESGAAGFPAALVANARVGNELVDRLHVRAEAVALFAQDMPVPERWRSASGVEEALRLVGASPVSGLVDASRRRCWALWWRLPFSLGASA